MQSYTEENYLKIIYHLSEISNPVLTNAIAERIQTKAASVTDMIKKLSEKGLVNYVKYQGVTLTEKGKQTAVNIVRKHRLWEVFLVDKLNFKWDEVHEVAEELEHIQSTLLVERLDEFLDYPKVDPHGDPIPDKHGNFAAMTFVKLSKLQPGDKGTITGVSEHSSAFLKHLEKLGLTLGKRIEIIEVLTFDGSVELTVDSESVEGFDTSTSSVQALSLTTNKPQKTNISREVAKHILITKN